MAHPLETWHYVFVGSGALIWAVALIHSLRELWRSSKTVTEEQQP